MLIQGPTGYLLAPLSAFPSGPFYPQSHRITLRGTFNSHIGWTLVGDHYYSSYSTPISPPLFLVLLQPAYWRISSHPISILWELCHLQWTNLPPHTHPVLSNDLFSLSFHSSLLFCVTANHQKHPLQGTLQPPQLIRIRNGHQQPKNRILSQYLRGVVTCL